MFGSDRRDGTKGWGVGDNEGNTLRFIQCGSVMGRKCFCPCDIVITRCISRKENSGYRHVCKDSQ